MQTAPKKVINAWAMYDWANSVYNLVITTTFFPIYFAAVTKQAYGEETVPFLGRTFKNSSLYDYALATAYAIIVLLLPILSSIADSRGNKKRFMQFFCYLGGLACCAMFFFKGDQPSVGWGIGCLMLASIGFVGSLVFYNSYLPEIAAPEDRDRVSAKGFSMGYIGSVLLQLVGFGLVLYFSGKGDNSSGPLYTFLLVGLWWMGFAQIPFKHLPKGQAAVENHTKNFLTEGFIELGKVWRQVKSMPVLKQFLMSFFFYSMGVQTVMLAATLFGSTVLKLPDTNLIVTVVLIQLVAIAGAVGMARLSTRFGNIQVLIGAVIFWIVVCVSAYFIANLAEQGINTEYYFYGLAVAVGLVMGGIQAISRSTYSKLMPVTKDTASFFSFYDVTEKVAIVIGMLSFGVIDEFLGMKNSVLSLVLFFCIGLYGLVITLYKQKRSLFFKS
ncbi:MFS transporter [Flavisolibacter tropicus]|uniref:MFS transporter permease n=1 Tax=Flavisolibacter tropicus TaxID=1492898 RepID=A0A172TZA0_9BACT|nr:MFS transporter [Flavisolibacter tropicus]ANE52326.1 MFS transporter permease [Flavisolibacter tropicus]